MAGPRGKVLFKETDLRRGIRAFGKEGRAVRAVVQGDRLIFEPIMGTPEAPDETELDRELKSFKETHPE